MKLRNKNTGEVVDAFIREKRKDDKYSTVVCNLKEYKRGRIDRSILGEYTSLAELNEEWEDYEPKEFWYIVQDGDIFSDNDTVTEDYAKRLQAIGNYFESVEEAKKAVEKLKAWKRLKDKGFRFEGWNWKAQSIDCSLDYTTITEEQSEEADKDIDLLFGGEE